MQVGKFIYELKEYERGVVFRYGRFKNVVGPGWVLIIPFIETCTVVDLRVKTIDVPPQEVVTKDNIKLIVDAIIYLKVVDPANAILKVKDYESSVREYICANLRDVIGKMQMSDVISNISEMNKKLHEGITKICRPWGIEVTSVEIQKIELPEEVISAMHKKKAAEQEKFAMIERATGKKIEIDAIQEAASKLTAPTLQYYYLQSLQKIAEGKSTKFIFPLELSKLASSLSNKLGMSYAEAQEEVLNQYQLLKKNEPKKPQKTLLEELREKIKDEEKEFNKYKTKKKKFEFDFGQ